MPGLVREVLRAWLAREKSLSAAVSDYAGGRTRPDLLASGLQFVAHSIGGYVLVSMLLEGLDTVVVLWQTSPRPYALALSVLQVSITLYVAVKVGKITEHLSEIHGKMDSKRKPMTIDTNPAIVPRQDPEREGPE